MGRKLEYVFTAVLTVTCAVMALGAGLLLLQITRNDDLFARIGQIEERLKVIIEADTRQTALLDHLGQLAQSVGHQIDKTLHEVQSIRNNVTDFRDTIKTVDTIEDEVAAVKVHITEMEKNPADVLRQHGIAINDEFAGVYVNGRVFLFPRTEAGLLQLRESGYQPHQLTPVLIGYRFPG